MRFYSAEEVHRALDLQALADAIAQTFAAMAVAPLRHAHHLSASQSLLLMPAWNAEDRGSLGVKLVTVGAGNRKLGAATVHALYVLFDRASGAPLAVLDGEALTLRRTAAASLLAARFLARADARNILIIGAGRLARYMAHAHCTGRTVGQLLVWGRNPASARTLASQLADDGLPATAAMHLEDAVAASDIVSCATTALSPVIRGAWLRAGTHVDLVGAFRRGMREADDAAVARSRVYVDTYTGALAEADDIIEPIARGVIRRDDLAELADLVKGAASGRRSAGEITLFKSVGTAIEDLAAARLVVEGATSAVAGK